MKKKIKAHEDQIGPKVSVDLAEVAMVEEYGQRKSKRQWIEALITLKSGAERRIKMAPRDFDDLILDWLDMQDEQLVEGPVSP